MLLCRLLRETSQFSKLAAVRSLGQPSSLSPHHLSSRSLQISSQKRAMESLFDVDAFQSKLTTSHLGRVLAYRTQVSSTMLVADGMLLEADYPADLHGHGVLSEEQTEGVGRRGRIWKSTDAENIYLSLIWSQCTKATILDVAKKLNFAISVATVLSIREVCGVPPQQGAVLGIKWPNDVWCNGKKLSGMIVNIDPSRGCVLGVGINVNEEFEEGQVIGDKAKTAASVLPTSLKQIYGQPVSRESLLASFCNTLEDLMLNKSLKEVFQLYAQFDVLKSQPLRVFHKAVGEADDLDYDGVGVGVALDGSYQVQEAGTHQITTLEVEEVSLRPLLKK